MLLPRLDVSLAIIPRPHASALPLLALLALFALSPLSSACSGCSGDNNASQGTQSATITVDSFTPGYAFPDDENTLSFSITPEVEGGSQDLSWRVDFGDGASESGEGIGPQSVSHTYTFSGAFEVTIVALLNEEEVGSTTVERLVYEPIDASIDGVRSQPANADTGSSISLFADFQNQLAADILTPVEVHAYLSTSSQVGLDDLDGLTSLGSTTIEALTQDGPVLAAGDERPISFDVTLPSELASGDYYLTLVLDPDQLLQDTDRTNNLGVAPNLLRVTNASQIQPDLVTTSILAAPDRAFPELNSFSRSVTLQNNGGLDLFDVVVETYLSIGDATLDDQDVLVHTSAPITQITARGGTAELPAETILLDQAIVPPADSSLEVFVIAKAQSTEAIEESDSTNNVLATMTPILVTDQPVDGPDIVVRDFSVTPAQTFINGSLQYDVEIANEGTSDVSSFLCRIYLGLQPRIDTLRDQPIDSINIPNLPSTESRQITDTITITELFDPGTYYVYVLCDPNNTLDEPFRSNNQKIFDQPVRITSQSDVDLFVRALTVPKNAVENEPVTLSLEVCSTGANATGPTKAALYRSPGNRVDFNAEPILTIDVPNLNPDQCEILPIEIATACEKFVPNYAFGIVLDSTNILPENDESNNARTGSDILSLTGTFCACNEDAFEPNNRPLEAADIQSGASSLALCDAGSCDFFRTTELLPEESLIVTNTHDPARGLLSTRLFDPSGVQALDLDRSTDGTQQVASFLGDGGSFIIEVCGTTPSTQNIYDLDIEIVPAAEDADLLVRRVTLPPQASFSLGARFDVSFELYNLGKKAADSFDIEVRISADDIIDANDPLLTRVTLDGLDASTQTSETLPVVLPTTLNEGSYRIGVIATSPATTTETNTDNNVASSSRFDLVTLCYDPLEPNDGFEDAYPISASGTFSNLISCTTAADYYEICVDNGKKFSVSATFSHAAGDIDVELFDNARVKIDDSATQNDTETVSVDYVNGAQCYTARVYLIGLQGQPPAENLYELQVNIEDVDPALLCSSYGEPNNTFDEATNLVAASQIQQLDRCPQSDSDFFYFDVGAVGQSFSISATKAPTTQPGTLRLQLYSPSRLPTLNDETAPDQPTASIDNYIAPQTGRYWVKISATGNARNVTYSLALTGLTGVDLTGQNLTIGPGTYREGDEIRLGFNLLNLGSEPTMGVPNFDLYIGPDPIRNPSQDISLSNAGSFSAQSALDANGSEYIFLLLNVPSGLMPGTAYIHLEIETQSDVNPANNVTSIPIQIAP